MGICKCRVVTSLFCFQHRLNVCEDCLVKEHPTCIVRTYLQWLQDNDFDPACKLCREPLNNGEPAIRLLCHDVFHGKCLNNYIASNFSADTAPAGYTCPGCGGKTVVPADNNASPVAVELRKFVGQAPWAALHASRSLPRAAPEQAAVPEDSPAASHDGARAPPALPGSPAAAPTPAPALGTSSTAGGNAAAAAAAASPAAARPPRPPPTITATTDGVVSRKGASTAVSIPEDEDKYARRPANAWFAQLVGNRVPVNRPADPNASLKRAAILFILLVIAFVTLIEVLTRARPSGEDDPLLDPHMNPNVRVD